MSKDIRAIRKECCDIWNNLKDKTKMLDYLIESKRQIADLEAKLALYEQSNKVLNDQLDKATEHMSELEDKLAELNKEPLNCSQLETGMSLCVIQKSKIAELENYYSGYTEALVTENLELKQQLAEKQKEIEEYKRICTISHLEDLQIENMLLKSKDQDKISFAVDQLEQLRHDIWTNQADDGYTDMQVDLYDLNDMIDIAIGRLAHQHEDKGE